MADKIEKTDAEWKEQLTREQFEVTRKKGTERAFSGQYWNNHEKGIYRCVCCGSELFSSDTKFEFAIAAGSERCVATLAGKRLRLVT